MPNKKKKKGGKKKNKKKNKKPQNQQEQQQQQQQEEGRGGGVGEEEPPSTSSSSSSSSSSSVKIDVESLERWEVEADGGEFTKKFEASFGGKDLRAALHQNDSNPIKATHIELRSLLLTIAQAKETFVATHLYKSND